ncbi:5'/3'-nucleotidase SurE [Candidatus Cloacimonadota bacterium]
MRILLTNDDGIDAPGIRTLKAVLEEAGHEITVIAPDKEQSAASHSITLHEPLRIIKRSEVEFAITGSPADCIILASRVILKEAPDLVISGINGGGNMAENILYSGTVAAALEAMFMGYKAIAISIDSHSNQKFETAAVLMKKFIDNEIYSLIGEKEVFNINVPNKELEEIKGVRITRTGNRHYQDFIKEDKDPRGQKIYWIGGAKPTWKDEAGTDYKELNAGYVSITPIAPNFTVESSMDKIDLWIQKENLHENRR